MTDPAIVLIAAVARNGVIGARGGLPWRLSSDMKRFKAMTLGKPVVMGRKTFETIGKPLAGRPNIVVTRDRKFEAAGVEVAHSLDQGLDLARTRAQSLPKCEEICVIGGGELYRLAMPLADRLYITHVLADLPGDTYFPKIREDRWEPVGREEIPATAGDSHPMLLVTYERRRQGITPRDKV